MFIYRSCFFHNHINFKSFISIASLHFAILTFNAIVNKLFAYSFFHVLYFNVIIQILFLFNMKRHFLFIKKWKIKNAIRQCLWRIKRKISRLQCHSKKRIDFFDDFQIIIQCHFSTKFVYAKNALSQFETNIIKNIINWFFNFYKRNNSKKSKIKINTSFWQIRQIDYKHINVIEWRIYQNDAN